MPALSYSFRAETWRYAGPAGWHFVSLPKPMAKEIRDLLRKQEAGWGRLPATARIGQTEWKTAIWFDTKLDTYLLPLKAEVRRKEQLAEGQSVSVTIRL